MEIHAYYRPADLTNENGLKVSGGFPMRSSLPASLAVFAYLTSPGRRLRYPGQDTPNFRNACFRNTLPSHNQEQREDDHDMSLGLLDSATASLAARNYLSTQAERILEYSLCQFLQYLLMTTE